MYGVIYSKHFIFSSTVVVLYYKNSFGQQHNISVSLTHMYQYQLHQQHLLQSAAQLEWPHDTYEVVHH